MPKTKKYSVNGRVITVAIIALAILLAISLSLLAIVILGASEDEPISSDNVIGITSQAPSGGMFNDALSKQYPYSYGLLLLNTLSGNDKVTLSWLTRYDGEKTFKAENMFPGDTEEKTYTVTVRSRNAQRLLFDVNIVSNGEDLKYDLADVLTITVQAGEETLYNGLISEIPQTAYVLKKGVSPQTVTYKISVSLSISVGNEYAGKSIEADFVWTLEESEESVPAGPEYEPVDPPETTAPSPDRPDPPETTVPDTTMPDTEPPEPSETTVPDTEPPEPPETAPPDTEPVDPPTPPPSEHENCCECVICHGVAGFFGLHLERCIMCSFVTALTGTDTFVCVCPWCCVIAVLMISVLLGALLLWLQRKLNSKWKFLL